MAGLGEHVTAMIRSHAAGDDASFYSVALQVAAREARSGHHLQAQGIKKAVDASRRATKGGKVTRLPVADRELDDLVDRTVPDVALRDLVGPPPLMEQVRQVIAEQRQRRTLLDHGFSPIYRLLLEGPPGTGKTLTASVLAAELELPMFTVRLDGLLSKYMGETAAKLRTVFDAVAEQRGMYLFDEFDSLGADGSGNDVGEARRILNSFLIFLEGASPDSLVLAATNHRSILDRALFRRFDSVLSYGLPDTGQAVAVIRARLGSLARGLSLNGLTELTSGLSHADLVKAAEGAAKSALMRGDETIVQGDLIRALTIRGQGSFG